MRSSWKVMLSTDAPPTAIQNELLQVPVRMGLRVAKESTLKDLHTAYLLMSHTKDELARNSTLSKQTSFTKFKKEFKSIADAAGNPISYILKLPASPAELIQKLPTVYRSVY